MTRERAAGRRVSLEVFALGDEFVGLGMLSSEAESELQFFLSRIIEDDAQ